MNKEAVAVFKMYTCVKKSINKLYFLWYYTQNGGKYMQKYVEIKRDGLTLRGMLHVPDNVSSKVPMVILLHGFCDDRNEINFVHNELSQRLCDAGIASVRFDMNGSGESDGRFEDMTISRAQ